MMIIDMDVELQRLICISMDKMTTSTRCKDVRNSRKCGGLNLRKALLVARVLQDMRNAYMSDDYTKLLNTIRPDLNHCEQTDDSSKYNESIQELKTHRKSLSDEWISGRVERPTRSEANDVIMTSIEVDTPSVQPQICTLNNDVTMSRSCQFTYPVPVSVNTKYVLSPRPMEDDVESATIFVDETPDVCQQVEVVSEENDEVETDISKSATVGVVPSVEEKPKRPTCPLPRKKRPLPKEFIEEFNSNNEIKSNDCKRVKYSKESCELTTCTTTASFHLQNTTYTTTQSRDTTLHTAPASSVNCTYVTTSVTSQISSTSSTNHVSTDSIISSPKVVVQEVNSKVSSDSTSSNLWTSSWSLPSTCRNKIISSPPSCATLMSSGNLTPSARASLRSSAHLPLIAC